MKQPSSFFPSYSVVGLHSLLNMTVLYAIIAMYIFKVSKRIYLSICCVDVKYYCVVNFTLFFVFTWYN